jgi:hypothetical protein
MELNLEYEQDFTKKGKESKFGGADYGIKGPKDIRMIQVMKIRAELLKYNILETRVYSLTNKLHKMNSVEYMNPKYLAAVIYMLEDIDGVVQYETEEDFKEIVNYIFTDKNFLKTYLDKIIDPDKEKDPKYMRLVKTTIFTYLFKIWANRINGNIGV